jgi:hypothetical protein
MGKSAVPSFIVVCEIVWFLLLGQLLRRWCAILFAALRLDMLMDQSLGHEGPFTEAVSDDYEAS